MPVSKDTRTVIEQRNLWPTPYWFAIINEFKEHPTKVSFNEDIKNYILGLEETVPPVRKSNRGGWQSELLNPEGEMKPLIIKIDEICKNLNLGIKETWIPQIWANVNRKHNWNIIHQHGSYSLSGTYYVKVPKGSGRLVFRDPRTGSIGNIFFRNNVGGGEFANIDIVEGMIVIWPSFIDHFVEPNESDEERISISFDILTR
jgi:hypothetical protein